MERLTFIIGEEDIQLMPGPALSLSPGDRLAGGACIARGSGDLLCAFSAVAS